MKKSQVPSQVGKADRASPAPPEGQPRSGGAAREASFGTRGSVDPRRLARMPEHMQREGLLLLREMGANLLNAAFDAGMGPVEAEKIITGRTFSLEAEWGL